MYKIDELVTEIYADEVIEISGDLTEQQKKLIETKVLKEIETNKFRRFPRRRKSMILLVASLVLILSLTVFATKKQEWDIALMNFMGLNSTDILQLEGGEVIINEKITSEWVNYSQNAKGEKKEFSITRITSIGDRNSAYLKINTDYELPKEFDEKTDYILPGNSAVDITYEKLFGNKEFCSYASEFKAAYEAGKLGFLISIENCENLNKCNVSLKIEDLYWYHDLGQYEETEDTESEELLAKGKWETNWKYSYKSNVKTIYKMKWIETTEGKIFLTKIEISPISIRIEAIRNPKDRKLPWTTELLEQILYKDGTKVSVETISTGGLGNGIFIDEFVDVYYLGEVLKPEEIKCLKICGQNVDI